VLNTTRVSCTKSSGQIDCSDRSEDLERERSQLIVTRKGLNAEILRTWQALKYQALRTDKDENKNIGDAHSIRAPVRLGNYDATTGMGISWTKKTS